MHLLYHGKVKCDFPVVGLPQVARVERTHDLVVGVDGALLGEPWREHLQATRYRPPWVSAGAVACGQRMAVGGR